MKLYLNKWMVLVLFAGSGVLFAQEVYFDHEEEISMSSCCSQDEEYDSSVEDDSCGCIRSSIERRDDCRCLEERRGQSRNMNQKKEREVHRKGSAKRALE